MVHIYYHYNNGRSKRASHCRSFATKGDASRWLYYMGMKYPAFHLDEVFEDESSKATL